jgi:hypothetical protein
MAGVLGSPAPIVFGTALGPDLFDATTDVPGTFVYSPGPGTVLGAGVHTLSVTFIPLDRVDYNTVTATTTITVKPAMPTVRVAGGGIYDGSPHAAAATVAGVAGAAGPSLEGIAPALAYYAGPTASGPALAGPPVAVGTYTVVATFPGSADYTGAASPPVTFGIAPASTAVTLTTSAGSTAFGQPVTLAAAVVANDPGAGTPTGTVTFLDGGATLGVAALDASGRATLDVDGLGLGGHSITAVYGGDALLSGARSGAVAESVVPASTRITLIPSGTLKGKKVVALSLTAEVDPLSPGAIVSVGVVTFRAKKKTLGTVSVVGGRATLTLGPRGVLNKPISVAYGGGSGFLGSSAAASPVTARSLVSRRAATRVALSGMMIPWSPV